VSAAGLVGSRRAALPKFLKPEIGWSQLSLRGALATKQSIDRRHSGLLRQHQTRNLEIPGSRWRAFRNDGVDGSQL
jgi:hypothetical protein